MYNYYLFNIDNELMPCLVNNKSYLFETLNRIYKTNLKNVNNNYLILSDMVLEIPKSQLNLSLFNRYKNDDTYIKYKNKHVINDYFSKEHSELSLNNLYIHIESTKTNPIFFNNFKDNGNWFVCDFKNFNYFWLKSYCNLS